MTKAQRMHKKLIKLQNRVGKKEGKDIWITLKKNSQ